MARKRTPYEDLFEAASRQYDIPEPVLEGQAFIESRFNPNAVSPANAFGLSQFIPSTAASYGVKRGASRGAVKSQIFGQAHYLSDLGYAQNPKLALSKYNAGPGNPGAAGSYAADVLAAAKRYGGGAAPAAASIPSSTLGAERVAAPPPSGRNVFDILGSIGSDLYDENDPVQQNWRILSGILQDRQQQSSTPAPSGIPTTGSVNPSSSFDVGGGRRGKVQISPSADRAGVRTSKNIISFAERVAGMVGHPLVLGTGTNHDQYTVNGNVSDHWGGNAGDFPASGNTLTKMGQAALIAAGMSPAQARKVKGGLFNLNYKGKRVQVIFNTDEGGNHFNHLHVGIR